MSEFISTPPTLKPSAPDKEKFKGGMLPVPERSALRRIKVEVTDLEVTDQQATLLEQAIANTIKNELAEMGISGDPKMDVDRKTSVKLTD